MPLDVVASYSHGVANAVAILKQQHLSLRGLRYPMHGVSKGGEGGERAALSLPSALSFLKMLAKDILRGLLPDLPHMLGELLLTTVVSALPGLVAKSDKDELLPMHNKSSAGSPQAVVGAGGGGSAGTLRLGNDSATFGVDVEGGAAAAPRAAPALAAPNRENRARVANRLALIAAWSVYLAERRADAKATAPATLWEATTATRWQPAPRCTAAAPSLLTPSAALRARASGSSVRGWLRVAELTPSALIELRSGMGLRGAMESARGARAPSLAYAVSGEGDAAPRRLRLCWCVLRGSTLFAFARPRSANAEGGDGAARLAPEAALPLLGASLEPLRAAPAAQLSSAVGAAAAAMAVGATPFGCVVLSSRGGALALCAESSAELCAWMAAIGAAS